MTKVFCCGAALLSVASMAMAADAGDSVAVVYNRNLPDSKKLAEYYAAKRGVPTRQLFGVEVNARSEEISRPEFRDKIQKPLFDWLVKQKLFTLNPRSKGATNKLAALSEAKIRYIVLCHGIPLSIARDTALQEDGTEKLQQELRGRNEAAVDADLALLPVSRAGLPLTGPLLNPFYLATNGAALHPTNGIVMVARLDGPSVEIARGLVDKALEAERNGLWGRAYFDARGLTDGDYKGGDEWIRASAEIVRRFGFETALDDHPATFAAGFPMSQVAFYAGWYDVHASGPFAQKTVEFMPGAFAYHLHSFSAATVRSGTEHWVGPLLAKGATITMGFVTEPYLAGTPNLPVFFERFIARHFTFGEAAYASQGSLSWQTTVVGDPLYCPFAQPPPALHAKLERENNPLVEWSHLRVVDLNQAGLSPVNELLKYLEQVPMTKSSAVLMEKVGDLQRAGKDTAAACESYGVALKSGPSPQQKIRLLLTLGELQAATGHEREAFEAYKQLVTDAPEYPDAAGVYRRLAGLAEKAGHKDEAEKFAKQAEQAGRPK